LLSNPGDSEAVIFSTIVESPGATWLRLTFRRVELGLDSHLRITSLTDGAVQHLNPRVLAQWGNTSAYFNGPAVRVELVAPGRSKGNVVEIGDLYAGVLSAEPESQCGPTDDRVPSNEPARGRLLDIGCTASIYTEESCFITAGHCLSTGSLVDVVEFNVPLSQPGGQLNHPPVEDQYPADVNSREFVNGGVGNDWGLFKVFPNNLGQMPFERQGARVVLGTTNPPVNSTINIVGYGVDSGTANQTQQISTGLVTSSTSSRLDYRADTEGGNSGSAVALEPTQEIVAIHTHGGCTSGGGANSGTSINKSTLQTALADFCDGGGGGGIPCSDIAQFQSVCKPAGGNTIQVRVTMTDTSHTGETVDITIDGTPHTLTITNRRANFAQAGFPSGQHTVSLTDPAGCVPNIVVNCP
jgi:V8-like Glu-specific endopeptidase